MAYAFVSDVPASWEHYEAFARAFEGPAPEGLLLHAAGPTEEGFRIIGVWESEEAWDRFRAGRLAVDVEAVTHAPPTVRTLVPRHVVRGGAPGAEEAAGS
jgi:hypothetical protein